MSDLIRRSEAIKALRREYPMMPMFKSLREEWAIKTEGFRKAEEVIMNLPSADRTRGEWKVRGNPKRNLWECSLCRCTIYSESESDRNEFHKWCGRCGARMRGADDEDN